jgi:predicted transposase YdaD
MGHDQIFKDFLRAFLKDFLELFFPKVEARLDFGDLRFLDTESFTSFPEGSSRAADIVAEVRRRNRARKILLVHVEVQAERRRTFRKRMFEYFTLLWMKHRVPIFPVAVYLRGGRSTLDEERFVMRLFGREQLVFRFPVVALARFDARGYVEKDSPVAAALASLMSRRGDRAPLNLRVSMMERVEQSGLDEARKFLLLTLIETYFELAGDEQQKFERLLSRERYREVKKMQLTWADKMKEEGRKEGLQKGRQEGRQEGQREGQLEGKREALLQLLTSKFGPLPEKSASRVRAIESLEQVDRYLDRVLVASSLADMGLGD